MTLKRIVLTLLTVVIGVLMASSLIDSFGAPQVGNQLQLYQSDLLVQASEWNGSGLAEEEAQQFRELIFGGDGFATAIDQYEEVKADALKSQDRLTQQLEALPTPEDEAGLAIQRQLSSTLRQQTQLAHQVDLRLGLLKIEEARATEEAISLWQDVAETRNSLSPVASTLIDLWQPSPDVSENAEETIRDDLRGWYRDRALLRVYEVQGNDSAQTALQTAMTARGESTLIKLSLIGLLPSLGGVFGLGLLIALIGQRLLRGRNAILAVREKDIWPVPWDWETVWLVIVGGFLFVGQVVLPFVVIAIRSAFVSVSSMPASAQLSASKSTLHIAMVGTFALTSSRTQALISLLTYLAMAVLSLGVMLWAIREHLPLPKPWFRFDWASRWPLWGLGGYLVALPLMLAISVINQQIWQGQGGNNPLLEIVLNERDPLALGMFLLTASVMAPLFEETLFRGFLLPSLTRYMPTWGAIGLSSLIFSVAHLSFSEVLPLTVLGAILGFVYVRSRNLLSAILLHSAWNSVTMIGLFLLGSGG